MGQRRRYRTVVTAVGVAEVEAVVGNDVNGVPPPPHGRIKRATATVDPAQDADAALGSGPATDFALTVREGDLAGDLPVQGRVVLAYSLASEAGGGAVASTFLDSEEDIHYEAPPQHPLRVGCRVDVGPGVDATVVVLLEIEQEEAP